MSGWTQSTSTVTWYRSPKLPGPSNQAFLKSFQHQKSVTAKAITNAVSTIRRVRSGPLLAGEGVGVISVVGCKSTLAVGAVEGNCSLFHSSFLCRLFLQALQDLQVWLMR